MKLRILFVALLVTVTALTGGAARGPVGPDVGWPTQACVKGTMEPMELEFQLRLTGDLSCGMANPPGRWGIARFIPGLAFGEVAELYDYAPFAPTTYSLTKSVPWNGTGYLCLVSDPNTRLACVSVKAQSWVIVSTAVVPVDHPGVSLPIVHSPRGVEPPTCGTCW
ncbi:hypothetical protein [Asanoa iriomotensis]|uniref:Secreted protein n=1 Tax=Asanoa iriomotensis TaxID=234613 RepID=A0ABQ4CEQ8_9ACTN|nr:hypothetical protein [Asanoa iriomotensis]GIF61261.1 hypothetical protein Air01nite_73560 [Asanoa iriomotensis]